MILIFIPNVVEFLESLKIRVNCLDLSRLVMSNITIGPDSDQNILKNFSEEIFPDSAKTNVQVLFLVSIILIFIINGNLIIFILNQSKRSEMDWMIFLHSIFCILNTFFIIRTNFTFTRNPKVCMIVILLNYFVNTGNRLLGKVSLKKFS